MGAAGMNRRGFLFGAGATIAIAISLKRIADSMEPTIGEAAEPSEAPPENAWCWPDDGGARGAVRLRDLVEVTFKDRRPNAQWLLGDAIDWSGPDLRLKSIFGAWRPIRR